MSRWGSDHELAGFWTILFAVAGGVLLADLVKVLLAAMLAHAALSALTDSLKDRGTTPGRLPARPGAVETRPATDARVALPGPVVAKSNAISRACIGGYVADRSGSGWTQRSPLEPCVADSE